MNKIGNIIAEMGDFLAPKPQGKPKYRLSQSLVKTLTNPWHCPVKFWEYEILQNYKRDATKSMTAGQFFEYLVVGSLNREGEVPVMPKVSISKKNPDGRMSADEVRIREQAKLFPEIMAKEGIELVQANVPISWRYNDELLLDGILDTRVRYKGTPCIMDIKLTADLTSSFSYYGFGEMADFDDIQAKIYTYIERLTFQTHVTFLYAVFDYKTNPEYKLIHVDPTDYDYMVMHERIEKAFTTLKSYFAGDITYRPCYDECRNCKLIDKCPCSITDKPVKKTDELVNNFVPAGAQVIASVRTGKH